MENLFKILQLLVYLSRYGKITLLEVKVREGGLVYKHHSHSIDIKALKYMQLGGYFLG
jgi:hypothetical protein